jgi:hypothetical protein
MTIVTDKSTVLSKTCLYNISTSSKEPFSLAGAHMNSSYLKLPNVFWQHIKSTSNSTSSYSTEAEKHSFRPSSIDKNSPIDLLQAQNSSSNNPLSKEAFFKANLFWKQILKFDKNNEHLPEVSLSSRGAITFDWNNKYAENHLKIVLYDCNNYFAEWILSVNCTNKKGVSQTQVSLLSVVEKYYLTLYPQVTHDDTNPSDSNVSRHYNQLALAKFATELQRKSESLTEEDARILKQVILSRAKPGLPRF